MIQICNSHLTKLLQWLKKIKKQQQMKTCKQILKHKVYKQQTKINKVIFQEPTMKFLNKLIKQIKIYLFRQPTIKQNKSLLEKISQIKYIFKMIINFQ